MKIYLVDNTLEVEIFYERSDQDYPDNICLRITEECPEEEKLFRALQTNIYLTPQQASQVAAALASAAEKSLSD